MDKVTKEEYTQLRNKGLSQAQIVDLARRGRVYETLNKETFKEKGLVRSVGGFLGMEEFGRGIGQTIANVGGSQERAIAGQEQAMKSQSRLLKRIKEKEARGEDASRLREALQYVAPQEDFEELGTSGLSSREVIGSAIQTGLSTASLLGAAPTAKGVGAALPKLAGSGIKKGVARGAIAGGLSGAAFGGAEAVTEGTGLIPGAAKGAAVGGAVGGVLGGVSAYIDDLTKVTPQSRLLETTESGKMLKRKFNEGAIYKKGPGGKRVLISDPISTIKNEGLLDDVASSIQDGRIKTSVAREKLRSLIQEQDAGVAEAVETAMKSGGAPVSVAELKKQAIQAVQNNRDLQARGVVRKTVREVSNLFDDFAESYGDDLTVANTNAIREGMNKVFNADTIDAERAIGDVMRKHVYQNAQGAQESLAREGQLIAADKFLDALDNKVVKGGRLGGYFSNLLGAMVGTSTEIPVAGPLMGALGANKVQQFMQSQQLNPISSRMARGVTELVNQLPTDTAGNISKTAVLNLIGQLSGRSTGQ